MIGRNVKQESEMEMCNPPVLAPITSKQERLAYWISNVFSPPILAVAGVFLVAHNLDVPNAWQWALLCVTLAVFVPVLYIVWLLVHGQVTDFHLYVREQRIKPMVVALTSGVGTWVVMLMGAAPHIMLVFVTIAIAQAVLVFLITLRWKISAHLVAVSGLCVLSFSLMGWAGAPTMLGVPLIAWSRVRLNRHSPMQTAAGALLGAITWFAALHLTGVN